MFYFALKQEFFHLVCDGWFSPFIIYIVDINLLHYNFHIKWHLQKYDLSITDIERAPFPVMQLVLTKPSVTLV